MLTFLAYLLISAISLVILFYSLIIILNFRWQTSTRNYELSKKLPGPKTLPIFGLALKIAALKPYELFGLIEELLKKYKPILTFRNIGYLLVYTINPDHVEELLKSSKYIGKGLEYFPIIPWLGTGLLTSKDEKWFARRKMLTPTFHFQILGQYMPIIDQNAIEMCSKLNKELFSTIDLMKHFSEVTLNIIVETAMGTKLKGKEGQDYIKAVDKACGLVVSRAQNLILINKYIFYLSWSGYQTRKCLKTLHGFTERVIKERKEEYKRNKINNTESKGSKRKAFLDFLIEFSEQDPKSMTDQDIREEVDTFMFEGHDTTAMSLSWTMFLLSCHQDIQDKVLEEINQILGPDENCTITTDHLKSMEYLEQIVKESLRLYPSVPYISRWVENDIVFGEYTIPAETNIGIFIYLLHRNPDIYPDPETFDPERFNKENSANRHPFAYIPFSAGQRNCIGQRFAMMEEKIVISRLLRKFKFEAVSTREELICAPHVILRPIGNKIMVRITPRNLNV